MSKTCRVCGCNEESACVRPGHRYCVPTDDAECSFCLEARGYVSMTGPSLRHTLVHHMAEVFGIEHVRRSFAGYDPMPSEVVRVLGAVDRDAARAGILPEHTKEATEYDRITVAIDRRRPFEERLQEMFADAQATS